MITINMLSSADKVKAQGVASAYIEQVNLVRHGLKDKYDVKINSFKFCDITHYHTIDLKFFLSMPFTNMHGTSVAYVHFVPETIDGSLNLPRIIKKIFYNYIIWFYKSADHLVVVNPYFIQALKRYGIDENKISYIPNFVSETHFYEYTPSKIHCIKQSLHLSSDKFVVLGVGQVQTRKGILDFIETAKCLPEVQFLWAGGFSFGAITDGYSNLKKVMNFPPKNVRFLGIIDREKMNDIYNISDIMFLPSYNELFPMSVLEAMALKKPILLRDLDIYRNILFNFYLKSKDVNGFVDIIKKLKSKGNTYKKWSVNSYACHKFYSEQHILDLWKKFYDEIYFENNKIKIRSRLNEK